MKPGTADELIRRAEADLAVTYRYQAGFVGYGLIKSGGDALISLSNWDTPDQAAAAAQTAAGEQRHFGEKIESVDNYVGDLAYF